jgi:hypothetical protein
VFRSAFLAAVVVLSIVVQECNVGSLLDLLLTYQVSAHNASSRTGFATVAIGSGSRDATLSPGATVVARSFKAGQWAIAVVDLDPELNAALVKLRQNVVKLLQPSGMTAAEVKALYAEQARLGQVVRDRRAAIGTPKDGWCSGAMNATDPPTDQELIVTATFVSGAWTLSGC